MTSPAPASLPQSPPPTPAERRPSKAAAAKAAGAALFREPSLPSPAETPDPRPSSTEAPLSPDLDFESGSLDDARPAPGRRSASSPPGTDKALDKAAQKRTLAGILKVISGIVQRLLATHPVEIEQRVWLMEDREAEQISDPLLSIAARHGLRIAGDLADALSALIATTSYVDDRLNTRNAIRAAYPASAPVDITPTEGPES